MREKKIDAFLSKTLSNKPSNVSPYSGTVTAHVLYSGNTEHGDAREGT